MLVAVALAFTVPLKGFASYKHYIHLKNGHKITLYAENKADAREQFQTLCETFSWMEDSYLTSRPRGGFMECEMSDSFN